jgi:capsular polysaccharide biosynthesis protein
VSTEPLTAPARSNGVQPGPPPWLPAHARGDRPGAAEDRLSVLWRAKYIVALAAIAAAAIAYGLTMFVTPTYESNTLVRVSSLGNNFTSSQDNTIASNDMALQIAQVVSSTSVVDTAAKALGEDPASLANEVTGLAPAQENVVEVTVKANSPDLAQRRAAALATAVLAYGKSQAAQQADAVNAAYTTQFQALDKSIAAEQALVSVATTKASGTNDAASITNLTSAQSYLSELQLRRQTLEQSVAAQVASSQPALTLAGSASAGSKVSPKPLLNAALALFIVGFVTQELAVVVRRRRVS